ncbi:hypothetical protein CLHUN_12940 [Ruminiclostridium hungatei]|uniref:NERD domain-containing protein n=1 Tax=Ruminiclostridium hungatei TaxID=48256 RepID=A0A1V4SME6_RUMHU|nr:hypothetical protein [Ruminiclostridium hungatei]OPX45062.1 hypothetical protein CLHUN_12940 [Ruminiclostridium hungatei]
MKEELINFYKLERLANSNPVKFLNLIKSLSEEADVSCCIKILKMSGICVDIYGTDRNRELYEQSLTILSDHFGKKCEEILIFKYEVSLLAKLIKDFLNLRSKCGVDNVTKINQIPAILLVAEIWVRSCSDYMKGSELDSIIKKYPFAIIGGDYNGKPIDFTISISQMVQSIDNIMEYVGVILKYLIHNNAPLSGTQINIPYDDLIVSRQHIPLIDKWDRLYHTYDEWKFTNSKIYSKKTGEITFIPSGNNDFLAHHISNIRFRSMKFKWMFDFEAIGEENIKVVQNTLVLPPEEFCSSKEALSTILAHEFFGSDTFKEECFKVSIAEWIRAYIVLRMEAENYLNSCQNINTTGLSINNWCIAKKRSEWIKIIEKGGVCAENAEIIINYLTFDKKAKDLLDCPLIPMDGYLVALPSFLANIEAASAMLSNFVNRGVDVSFKGYGFERRVLNKIKSSGFSVVRIVTEEKNETYECDAVFVMGEELFLLELKSFLQPHTIREHYELKLKIQSAVSQLNRISDFYSNRIDIIKDKLNLPSFWIPKKIHKVIVCMANLGEALKIDDCVVVDESVLRRFFDREAPAIVIGNKKIVFFDEAYEGDIKPEKLLTILSEPPQIKIAKSQLEYTSRILDLDNIQLKFFDFVKKTGDFTYLSKDDVSAVANILKIPPQELIDKTNKSMNKDER